MVDTLSDIAVPITAIVVGAFISFITYQASRRNSRRTSLIETFRMLDDPKHREARAVLYGNMTSLSFEILGLGRPTVDGAPTPDEIIRLSRDIVRTDFNEIGLLVYHELLDGEIFVREFYWVILRVWQLLEGEIMERRNGVGPPNYMEHLEEMHKMA